MIEMMKGAGVRCFKHRAGMPVLGIVGKMMNTRFNGGCLPLLDSGFGKSMPTRRRAGITPTTPGTATRIRRIPFSGTGPRTATWTSRHALLQAEHQLGQNFVETRCRKRTGSSSPSSAAPASSSSRRNTTRRPTAPTIGFRCGWRPMARRTSSGAKIIFDENLQDIDLHQGIYRPAVCSFGRIRCSISIRVT